MKTPNSVFSNNIHLVITTLVMFVLACTWGCILVRDPIRHSEFYKGISNVEDQSTVFIRTLRLGDEYESGPDVRFIDDEGIIWELRLLSNDPKYWSLVRIQHDGTKEVVPLRLVDTGSGLGYSSSPVWLEE